MKAPTDESLLRDHLDGKRTSFELLVRRYAQELHQFVLRFTRSSVAAEDVVQETFLQVYTSAPTFDFRWRFKPWLFTIAANKARDHLRSRKRKREVPIEGYVDAEDDAGQRFIELLAAETPPPDDPLTRDEKRRLVRSIVEEMPDPLREVLILAYYHRFPYRDIAGMIDIPLGTVKSRLHAAVTCFGERYLTVLEEHSNHDSGSA